MVDPHGQSDHDDHKGDEEDQVHGLTDERRYTHGNDDGHEGQAYGHEGGGDGADEDDENYEGYRNADAFSPPQVLFRQLVVLVRDAGVLDHEDPKAFPGIRFLDNVEDSIDVSLGLCKAAGQDQGH